MVRPSLVRQVEQQARHAEWLKQGHLEWPVQLDTYMKPHQQARVEWLARNSVGRILEVGCSWGYILAACHGHVGVDLNPENIELARQLARERDFRVANALSLPFEDRSFDTVLLPDVLEHMPFEDVNKAIIEATRVSRGRVLITLPKGDEDTEDATNQKHVWLPTWDIVYQLFGRMNFSDHLKGFYTIKLHWADMRNG